MQAHPMPMRSDKSPLSASPEAEAFYANCLKMLVESGIPFLLGGTFAVSAYTGINRPTKDIDVFCTTGDYPRILGYFRDRGFDTEVLDERWIAKVRKGPHFFDVIFNSTVAVTPVTEQWFTEAPLRSILGQDIKVTPPTELIWSKVFVQSRERYDGADVYHVMLTQHEKVDWRRLLSYMDPYWELLLIHALTFRFIYPSERNRVPQWLFDELMDRLHRRNELPVTQTRVCRGRLLSRPDYLIDVSEWGFADVVGDAGKADGYEH